MKKCRFCGLDFEKDDSGYCGLECVRWDRLCVRIKRLEDVLVEIKYELRR